MLSNFVQPGKVSLIIDGQFGSTGKGLIASRIAYDNHIDVCAASLSPNAGHTFYKWNAEEKLITKLLPVCGILKKRSTIYLSPESVINEDLLIEEIEKFNIENICIHPRASIVQTNPNTYDKELAKIGSTLQGTGPARASKILRKNPLIFKSNKLKKYIDEGIIDLEEIDLNFYLDQGCSVLIESGQGIDLGLNYGLSYPYCTSRDVLPANLLADFGIHPKYLGNIMLTFRTYPIRVGNPIDNNGNEIGYSGPFFPDSKEITWKELNQKPELTTVTKRIRRIATFSKKQFEHSIDLVKPSHIFLNFINYLNQQDIVFFNKLFLKRKEKIFVGYDKFPFSISPLEPQTLQNYFLKF